MLLLYLCSPISSIVAILYLHSTMLLLYRLKAAIRSKLVANLHSTMLLLYLHHARCIIDIVIHLHSTMLLLYLVLRYRPASAPCIYIPLCFYFIDRFCVLFADADQFTFHYASTLSPAVFQKALGERVIYSPLCFYFIILCSFDRDVF